MPLEDRAVPAVVTISAIDDEAAEGGSGGMFRLTRTTNTGSLDVYLGIGGTATSGTDYTAINGTQTIPNGEYTLDIPVSALTDNAVDPEETVELSIEADSNYTVGSPYLATVTILDDPPVVSVAATDVAEGSDAGGFTFTRVGGKLSSSLSITYSLDGTADSGDDYTALTLSATFPANEDTVFVPLEALHDGVYDPDETVILTVYDGDVENYLVDEEADEATATIADDIDAVETLIHEDSFQLQGTSENVDVTLTVVYNASGAEGLYTWTYVVSNPSINTTDWTDLSIPVDDTDGLGDVDNLSSSIGWTGSIGTDEVSWSAGTALAPGKLAAERWLVRGQARCGRNPDQGLHQYGERNHRRDQVAHPHGD